MNKLIKKIKINTVLTADTGLRIGASKEGAEIGGIDLPVIRNGWNNQPYIPGSSLKGKIRSLLEQNEGISQAGADGGGPISLAFGSFETGGSKIIFRDAPLTKEAAEHLSKTSNLDLPFTEIKTENAIDRVTGTSQNGALRTMERVPAGASFDVEIIVNVYSDDPEGSKTLALLRKGVAMLNDDYLGGGGSRGHGKVTLALSGAPYQETILNL
jgi:CRISPR-associated protein Csm3